MPEEARAGMVRDPTMYQVLPLVAWIPGDDDARAEQRRAVLEHTLRDLGLAPPGTKIPPREALAWKEEERWSSYAPDVPPAPGAWRTHRYGRSYHELLVVLAGVEQQGRQPFGVDWDQAAQNQIDAGFARARGWPREAFGHIDERPDTVAAFGEAWIWTGEWESVPAGGWAASGKQLYAAGAFAAWPWGLLGFVPATDGEIARFDLHTTQDAVDRRHRDRFLFEDLLILIAEWLKATRLHWAAYRKTLGPNLDAAERRIRSATESLPASASVEEVGLLSTLLFSLCHREAELEDTTRSVAIARAAITARLRGAEGGLLRTLGAEVRQHASQMRSDLAYYRTSERRARAALEAVRTLAEVKENQIATWRGHLQEWRGRFQEQLTNLIAALGLGLGVGQLLPTQIFPIVWSAAESRGEPFILRLGAAALLAVIGYVVSRILQRIRGRKVPPAPPPSY